MPCHSFAVQWATVEVNRATMTTDKHRVTTYISDDLKRELQAIAAVERRSLSGLIAILLEEAVARAKSEEQ